MQPQLGYVKDGANVYVDDAELVLHRRRLSQRSGQESRRSPPCLVNGLYHRCRGGPALHISAATALIRLSISADGVSRPPHTATLRLTMASSPQTALPMLLRLPLARRHVCCIKSLSAK